MNLFKFIYKFILIDTNTRKFSYVNFFPFAAQIVGVLVVLITLSIMNGLEDSIYKRLKIFNLFNQITIQEQINIEKKLNDNNIDYLSSYNVDLVASSNNKYIPIKFKGISDFPHYSDAYLNQFLIKKNNDSLYSKGIYIGESLSSILNVSAGDRIELINPNELNFLTSYPKKILVEIAGIYNSQIIDIDGIYVFGNSDISNYISNSTDKTFYLIDNINNYPEIKEFVNIKSWKLNHLNFIEAYNNEKILYSSFGYIVIIISAFTLSGIITISIRKRLGHMSILRAIGYNKKFFIKIYTYYISLFSIFSFIVSLILSIVLYRIDIEYGILEYIFPPYIYFPFEVGFSFNMFLTIFLASYIITLLSTLSSIYSIFRTNIIQNIKKYR